MAETTDLPSLYELVALECTDDVMEEAKRRARQGAEEGTLVWAKEQSLAWPSTGQPVDEGKLSPRGDLYCALVLRPEFDLSSAIQLNYVGVVSAGLALAGLVSAMTALRYGWPNELRLNDAPAGTVLLESAPLQSGRADWLVLGLNVHVATHLEESSLTATSLHAVGATDASDADVLQDFSRYFLTWINRWAEEGFEPVRRTWLQRAEGVGQLIEVPLRSGIVRGMFKDVDEEGALVVTLPGGDERRVHVGEYFGIQTAD